MFTILYYITHCHYTKIHNFNNKN